MKNIFEKGTKFGTNSLILLLKRHNNVALGQELLQGNMESL